MVSYHHLEHCFNDFVDCLNLAISMGVVGRWVLVFEFQHGWNINQNSVFKVFTMVWDQLFGNTKSWNDVVKEETCHCFTFAIKCGHGLDPLSEVINCHNDVFMTVAEAGLIVIKSISHLQKGTTVTTGCNGAGGVIAFGAKSWQLRQCLTASMQSAKMEG